MKLYVNAKAQKSISDLKLKTMASNPLHLLPKFLHHLPTISTISSITCSFSPPSSREEAIHQAKSRLSSSLHQPKSPLPSRKSRNHPQPRLRVEIPIADDASPSSLASLAADLFSPFPLTNNLLLIWPSPALLLFARQSFASSAPISHSEIASVGGESLKSADWVAFVAPEASMLEEVRAIVGCLGSKPVVLLNPRWGFEEEKEFGGKMRRFVGSFDVVYSFMGLEVRGVLRRRKGVVFRSVGEWLVMVEDEGGKKGELRVVSRFERRPEIGEVEDVLYNLVAADSPITRSVKFLRDLASNVAGKKKE